MLGFPPLLGVMLIFSLGIYYSRRKKEKHQRRFGLMKTKTFIIFVLLFKILGTNNINQTSSSIIVSSQEIKEMNIQMLLTY